MIEYGAIKLSSLEFEFQFITIPAGGCSGTTDRSLESVMKKTSVRQIVKDDNCFWYAMSLFLNPKNKTQLDHRYPNTRIKLGKEICAKSRCDWDKPVSFLQLPLVEEKFNCNIYVIDAGDIPTLGSSISLLMNCLMYKSQNRGKEQHYLLYHSDREHYDCITDIKKFLGVREFCPKCFRGFTNKDTFENHTCEECQKPKKVNQTNAAKLLKDLAHYIQRGICKGSKKEVDEKYKTLKNPDKIVEQIQRPKYIVFDFETDTHRHT